MTRRVVFVVLDGVGVGALPDAGEYGDTGSDTLGNLGRVRALRLPLLRKLGLGNVEPVAGVSPVDAPLALVGRLAPLSVGKDTTVGHWEHMGLITKQPFPTYPRGFPAEVIEPFKASIGRGVLGNRPASGTAIIAELGERHLETGEPIVYTSADSVFQIAAHEERVPIEVLYQWCEIARTLLSGAHAVARVIARPFVGRPGAFSRTQRRKDFSLQPPGALYLDHLQASGVPVIALGKISEIYGGRGIRQSIKVGSNAENLLLVGEIVAGRSERARFTSGLLMTNLVDFDTSYGHRNDVEGFARALESVDRGLRRVIGLLGPEDVLIVTADHGVDPTTPSTDHSREHVPVLLYPRPGEAPADVYEGAFSDTGATVYEYLTGTEPALEGRPLGRLRPTRGWRPRTPVQGRKTGSVAGMAGRLGPSEAGAAGRWLRANVGPPPGAAVILGSGLNFGERSAVVAEAAYGDVPHWPVGAVPGHPQRLVVARWEGGSVAVLAGRVHEYEGCDLSEVQFAVRALAAWGVEKIVLTSAAGAVAPGLSAGAVVVADEVLDFQYPTRHGDPVLLPATRAGSLAALRRTGGPAEWPVHRLHASVPGPQYETPAELQVLAARGVATVSMSPAGELRAVHDEGLGVAVVAVVANVGDTTHEQVLAGCNGAAQGFEAMVAAILAIWGADG